MPSLPRSEVEREGHIPWPVSSKRRWNSSRGFDEEGIVGTCPSLHRSPPTSEPPRPIVGAGTGGGTAPSSRGLRGIWVRSVPPSWVSNASPAKMC